MGFEVLKKDLKDFSDSPVKSNSLISILHLLSWPDAVPILIPFFNAILGTKPTELDEPVLSALALLKTAAFPLDVTKCHENKSLEGSKDSKAHILMATSK